MEQTAIRLPVEGDIYVEIKINPDSVSHRWDVDKLVRWISDAIEKYKTQSWHVKSVERMLGEIALYRLSGDLREELQETLERHLRDLSTEPETGPAPCAPA